MIKVQELSKQYRQKRVLDNVSFDIPKGQCVALIGPNGAGKSTLMECIIGDKKASHGYVTINEEHSRQAFAQQLIGVLPQENAVPEKIKVAEIIAFFRSIYQNPLSNEAIDDLLGFSKAQKQVYAEKLSGGQKRLLSFVLILIGQPKIIFLDEPTTAMDTSTRKRFWTIVEELKKQGCTIFYSSHYIEEVEHTADRVLVLHQGKILRDTTPHLMRQEEQEKYFTVPKIYQSLIENSQLAYHSLEEKGEVIFFATKEADAIWYCLEEAGCRLSDIELTNKTLLNTLFDTTHRNDLEREEIH